MTRRQTAYHFFLSHAGYSYDPKTETKLQGRIRCAQALAAAEKQAKAADCTFEWQVDADCDSSDFSDEVPPWSLWGCIARDADGQIFASLWGIDFGRDGMPVGDPYSRVVEAELATEYKAER